MPSLHKLAPRLPGGALIGGALALAAVVSYGLAGRLRRSGANEPTLSEEDVPDPVSSGGFSGGFSSGYEGPDRRVADRGVPVVGDRRQR